MHESKMKRLRDLKRRQNGARLKPALYDKVAELGFSRNLKQFVDPDKSYELFEQFKKRTEAVKAISLRDSKKEHVVSALESIEPSDWSAQGVLFFHHYLDAGAFEVGFEFLIKNLFELCTNLDGDTIYYLDVSKSRAIYFDRSSNNIDPDNCFDLEIW